MAKVKVDITDTNESFALVIRHGATELTDFNSAEHSLNLTVDRRALAELILGQKRLKQLNQEKRAVFTGRESLQTAFVGAFDDFI